MYEILRYKEQEAASMKETIRSLALSMGADICGFADMDRFANAPDGFSPKDIFTDCQSVVTIGVALAKGLLMISSRLVYQYYNELILTQIDQIALRLAKEIEYRYGCTAVPVPCDTPYEYWDAEHSEGRGLISMRHAAVYSGIGTLGKNTMVLNRDFGNLLNIGLILTDLSLPSDALAASICIQSCTKCVDSCPVSAIRNGSVIQKLCREYTCGKTARGYETLECNLCRTVCPLVFGLRGKAL